MKVTIIGCGHGGQALAADLSQRGCHVTLYAHPQHPGGFHAIAKTKGIHCTGLINQFVTFAHVTTHLHEAVVNSDYIFIVLPSYAYEATFIEMLPFLQSGQTVITLASNFASLVLLKLLSRTNKAKGIQLIDMSSLPYVCRANNTGSVEILAVKQKLAAASIPAASIQQHIRALAPIFPCQLVPVRDVLSLGMNITNGIAHPVVTLFNAGRIGNQQEFYFYRDGVTHEIANIMERLDVERMQIGQRLGLEMYTFLELAEKYYGQRYESIYQHFRESLAHNTLPMCPTSLQHRFITEDVAGSLVSWYCLGKLTQLDSSVLSNLIHLASLLNNTNYLRTGANLVHLDLHDKTMDEIKKYVSLGELPMGSFPSFVMPVKQAAYFPSHENHIS